MRQTKSHLLEEYFLESEYLGDLKTDQEIDGYVLVVDSKERRSKNGNLFGVVTVEDMESNKLVLMLFGKDWEQNKTVLSRGNIIDLKARCYKYKKQIYGTIGRKFYVFVDWDENDLTYFYRGDIKLVKSFF